MDPLKSILEAPQEHWANIEFMRDWARDYLLAQEYTRFDLETYAYDPEQGRCGWRYHIPPDEIDRLSRKYLEGRGRGVRPTPLTGAAWRVFAAARYLLERGYDERANEIFVSERSRLEGYAVVHSIVARINPAKGGRQKRESTKKIRDDWEKKAKDILARHPDRSDRAVAIQIDPNNWDYIRKIVRKVRRGV